MKGAGYQLRKQERFPPAIVNDMVKTGNQQNPEFDGKDKYLGSEVYHLFLHNDDVHSFEFVIQALVEVCDHTPVQAEQCATITHHHGRCMVRKGDRESIGAMRDHLAERGLTTSIERINT